MRSTRSQLGGVLFPPLPLVNMPVTEEGLRPRRAASCFFCTPARFTSSSSPRKNPASRSIASCSATAASHASHAFGVSVPSVRQLSAYPATWHSFRAIRILRHLESPVTSSPLAGDDTPAYRRDDR